MIWTRVASGSDLEPGSMTRVLVDSVAVAVVRDDNGDLHAIDDLCSHGNVSLSEGELEGCVVECWLHGSRFDLRSGKALNPPATEPVAVHDIKLDGDDVLVALNQI